MIDLLPEHLAEVKSILRNIVPDCEIRACGSRIVATASRYSDLDLAIRSDRVIGQSLVCRSVPADVIEAQNKPLYTGKAVSPERVVYKKIGFDYYHRRD